MPVTSQGRKWPPLQYPCLENSKGRQARWALQSMGPQSEACLSVQARGRACVFLAVGAPWRAGRWVNRACCLHSTQCWTAPSWALPAPLTALDLFRGAPRGSPKMGLHTRGGELEERESVSCDPRPPLPPPSPPVLCGVVVRITRVSAAQSYPTLHDATNCSLPGSSVHGILQARRLEWAAISFSGGSS